MGMLLPTLLIDPQWQEHVYILGRQACQQSLSEDAQMADKTKAVLLVGPKPPSFEHT